tara:strand:- start:2117 stop:2269 length:153 start_codon:yes stop_codon:yes gene_type:complete
MLMQKLTWQQWLKIPKNKKLSESNMESAKRKYHDEQSKVDQYLAFLGIKK